MKARILTTMLALAAGLSACSGDSPESLLAAAKTEIEKKDSKAAIIQLKNALQLNPSLAEARFLLGKLLLESGDAVGAAVELGKAQQLDAPPAQVAPLLARAMLMQGQSDRVISTFATTELKSPAADAELRVSVASAYAMRGKQAEAEKMLASALRADPENVAAGLLKARLLLRQREIPAAQELLDKLASTGAGNAEAWQIKGDLLLESGKTEEAIAAYRQALQRDKRNLAAHTALLWSLIGSKDMAAAKTALEAMKQALPSNPSTKLFEGVVALENGDLKAAHEHAQALLKLAPDHVRTLQLAGAVEFRRGSLLQAEAHLIKVLKLAPDQLQSRLMLAQTQLRAGDPEKTLSTLGPLLGEKSTMATALSLAAEAHLQRGESDKAEVYFKRAATLNPQDQRSRVALALAQVAKGEDAQGFEALRGLAEHDTAGVSDLALVSAHISKRQWAPALKAIDSLERKQPTRPTAANLRGRVQLLQGNRAAAREAFEAALKIDPVFFAAAASLAKLDMEDRKPEQALKRFETLLATDTKNLPAQMAIISLKAESGLSKPEIAELLSQLIKTNPTELGPRLALVRLQIERKEAKLALAAAQDALASIPDKPELLDMLSRAELLNGQTNQAITSLNKWASLQPSSPQPSMRLAEIYMDQKDSASAIQHLKRALNAKPDHVPAQRALMGLEIEAGRVGEARAIARAVLSQHPKDAVGHMLEGDLEQSQKNWAAAITAYRAGLAKNPGTELAVRLHRTLLAADKASEAQSFEAQWLKQHPADAAFAFYLADFALSQGRFELAEQRYLGVLKQLPDNAMALNNVAWLMNRGKRSEAALEYAERAVKLQPRNASYMDTLADVLVARGQLERALGVQKQAVEAAPEVHEHRLHLARYYAASGKKTEAREELNRLAKLGDKFRSQEEVKKLLGSL